MRILVTDGHELAALATVRSLGRAGHDVLLSSHMGRQRLPTAHSRYVSRTVRTPHEWEEHLAYVDWLRSVVQSGDIDAVFPISEASLVGAVSLDAGGVAVVAPDESSRRLALSKMRATDAASAAGLLVPHTTAWVVNGRFDDDAIAIKPFPFVVKSDNIMTSVGTYRRGQTWVINDADSLHKVRLRLAGMSHCDANVQSLVGGRGVSACFYAEHGTPLLSFGHRRLHEVPYTGGWSSLRESHHDDALLDLGRRLMSATSYTGLAMVEFRQDVDGSPYFMEINGRPWASMALAIHAGADFPLLALERAAGVGTASSASPRAGRTVCMNLAPGEIAYVRSVIRARHADPPVSRRFVVRHIASVARYLFDPRTRHDHVWLRDLRPALALITSGTVRLLQRASKSRRRVLGRNDEEYSPKALVAGETKSVLWICSGNVCRSPFLERLVGRFDPGIVSRSAGLHAVPGSTVPDWMRGLYDEHGIRWEDHRSQEVTQKLVDASHVIVCMEQAHRVEFVARFPDAAERCWLIGELADLPADRFVDPYMLDADGAFDVVASLATATERIAARFASGSAARLPEPT